MSIRLIETTEKPFLLSQLKKLEENVEFSESFSFGIIESDAGALENKVTLLAGLVDDYIAGGYREAAIAAVRKLESLFFEWVETTTPPIEDDKFDLLISTYLKCGLIDEAFRSAEKTANVLGRVLGRSEAESDLVSDWLRRQFNNEIDAFKKRQVQRVRRMESLRTCIDCCPIDQTFVIDLKKKQTENLKGA